MKPTSKISSYAGVAMVAFSFACAGCERTGLRQPFGVSDADIGGGIPGDDPTLGGSGSDPSGGRGGGQPAQGGAGGRMVATSSPAAGATTGPGGSPTGGRSSAGLGGSLTAGATTRLGGSPTAGTTTRVGGSPAAGGTTGLGGSSSGGTPSTGTVAGRDAGSVKTDAAVPGAAKVDPVSGYATVSAGPITLSGFVFSSAGGSGSAIGLTCTATSFCAKGTVGASATYNAWATSGLNVNQSQSGA
ncbi:MAG TPA: hypothetical protein VF518_15300, partial [Polyangia bacterium]